MKAAVELKTLLPWLIKFDFHNSKLGPMVRLAALASLFGYRGNRCSYEAKSLLATARDDVSFLLAD
jgi:hypothetical protein